MRRVRVQNYGAAKEPPKIAYGTWRKWDMAREQDPAETIETIAQSIRVSQRGARRVRAHRFKELFGYRC